MLKNLLFVQWGHPLVLAVPSGKELQTHNPALSSSMALFQPPQIPKVFVNFPVPVENQDDILP